MPIFTDRVWKCSSTDNRVAKETIRISSEVKVTKDDFVPSGEIRNILLQKLSKELYDKIDIIKIAHDSISNPYCLNDFYKASLTIAPGTNKHILVEDGG